MDGASSRETICRLSRGVPPGETEERHAHDESRRSFHVIRGEAVLELDGEERALGERHGIEVPERPHQFRNESDDDVGFLVASVPRSRGNRVRTPHK